MGEILKYLCEILASPPTIGYLLLALLFAAGPEKIIKLFGDYCRTGRRLKLCLIQTLFRCRLKHPIISIEDIPEDWSLEEEGSMMCKLKISHKAVPRILRAGQCYDIWVDYKSLRKRERFKDSYWEYLDLEPNPLNSKDDDVLIFRQR